MGYLSTLGIQHGLHQISQLAGDGTPGNTYPHSYQWWRSFEQRIGNSPFVPLEPRLIGKNTLWVFYGFARAKVSISPLTMISPVETHGIRATINGWA